MTRLVTRAALLGGILAAWTVGAAYAQDPSVPVLTDPTAAVLATAAGIAGFVALITNILRGTVPPDAFDRWGPTIAVVVGIILALVGEFVAPGTHDGNAIVTAVLVGLMGGWMSQNVNTQVTRLVR